MADQPTTQTMLRGESNAISIAAPDTGVCLVGALLALG
jgi:hypothetical protein